MPYNAVWDEKTKVPTEIAGFEDLVFLFTSSHNNRGILRMDFDEAVFLWKIAKQTPPGGYLVEIGRAEGGSTILLAAATEKIGTVVSFDNDPVNDKLLSQTIAAAGLYAELFVADSQTYDTSKLEFPVHFLFIDGEHTYEGVKRDFDNWWETIIVGGILVLHDVDDMTLMNTGPSFLYPEILKMDNFEEIGRAGSVRALRRIK